MRWIMQPTTINNKNHFDQVYVILDITKPATLPLLDSKKMKTFQVKMASSAGTKT